MNYYPAACHRRHSFDTTLRITVCIDFNIYIIYVLTLKD
jgi:hypothetical protein